LRWKKTAFATANNNPPFAMKPQRMGHPAPGDRDGERELDWRAAIHPDDEGWVER
jgi:hypothetical protein